MTKNLPAKAAASGYGAVANYGDFADQFAAEAGNVAGGGGGKAFMKFDGNSGDFSFGANSEELELGSRLVLDVTSYARGWVCWKDGNVVEEVMVPLSEGHPPRKHELTDHGPYDEDGDGWVEQYTIEMRQLEDEQVQMIFQANNASKRRAMGALMKAFAAQFKKHPGCAPVVEIDQTSFEIKGKRKITKYAPIFNIVEWLSAEELGELFAVSDAPAEEEEDEKPKRRSSKPKDEEEDERPARRSRSKKAEPEEEPDEDEGEEPEEEPEEEDERPRRRSSKRKDDEDEDEEEDEPASKKKPARRGRF